MGSSGKGGRGRSSTRHLACSRSRAANSRASAYYSCTPTFASVVPFPLARTYFTLTRSHHLPPPSYHNPSLCPPLILHFSPLRAYLYQTLPSAPLKVHWPRSSCPICSHFSHQGTSLISTPLLGAYASYRDNSHQQHIELTRSSLSTRHQRHHHLISRRSSSQSAVACYLTTHRHLALLACTFPRRSCCLPAVED